MKLKATKINFQGFLCLSTKINTLKNYAPKSTYHNMVGNLHGVLIFVTFVVDLAVTKFPPMKLMPMVILYVSGDR